MFSYVSCVYKRPQRDYYMFVLSKSLLMLPVDVFHLNFNDLQLVRYEKDTGHSHSGNTFIKMTIVARGQHFELNKMDADVAQNMISFLKKKSLTQCKFDD